MAHQHKLQRLLWGKFSWKRLLRSSLLIYGVLMVFSLSFGDRLLFQPPPPSYQAFPALQRVTMADGNAIAAFYLPNPQATYTMLYSHGNAEDLGLIQSVLTQIRQAGFSVFAYDYPGYGLSQGQPSEAGAYAAVQAAYEHLTQQLQIPPERIIVHGRSVGGGPAVYLASRQPVAGLIVESSFVSVFRVVTSIPLLPFDKFPNLARIKQVRCPVLIIHGQDDRLIPLWHGQALFEAAQPPKQFFWVEAAGHNDLVFVAGDRYPQVLQTFARQLSRSPQI